MKKNFDTATLTFHYVENYGAVAQAYALQQKILDIGHKNTILNYRSKNLTNPFSASSLKNKGLVRYLLGIAYWVVRCFRKRKFDKFRSKMNIGKKLSKEDLRSTDYDFYIVGSDQVWNHEITRKDDAYQLSFVNCYNKRKSYAASFGFDKLMGKHRSYYEDLLENFSSINVRENSAVLIAKSLTDRDVNLTLDPTFLLKKEEWLKITCSGKSSYKYILTYQITASKKLLKFTKNLKRQWGMKSISIPFPIGGLMKSRIDLTAGPEEWINYIVHSEMVVTDSFHGVALCIILNKPFKVILTGLPTRIVNVLKIFGLEHHIIDNVDQDINTLSYDWNNVNRLIKVHRENSISLLEIMFE